MSALVSQMMCGAGPQVVYPGLPRIGLPQVRMIASAVLIQTSAGISAKVLYVGVSSESRGVDLRRRRVTIDSECYEQ